VLFSLSTMSLVPFLNEKQNEWECERKSLQMKSQWEPETIFTVCQS
jgi:hypothetical protein